MCIEGCLASSLTSTHQMLVVHTQLWQPKISPALPNVPKGKITQLRTTDPELTNTWCTEPVSPNPWRTPSSPFGEMHPSPSSDQRERQVSNSFPQMNNRSDSSQCFLRTYSVPGRPCTMCHIVKDAGTHFGVPSWLPQEAVDVSPQQGIGPLCTH